ncbi:MAG TPA: 4-hydroxythreonine-4-phosphate dehydrogenase PdxA [Rhizomicrobium sp.]|nr:4-hydroxythreonine-4-phosphate dehydrogenase PdxA [Rhizomicrobium sp.]
MPSPLPPLSADAPIYLTMGEPSGIGPEVAMAAFHALGGRVGLRALKLVGDARVFAACGSAPADAFVETHPVAVPRKPGRAEPQNTRAVVDAIDVAVALARDLGGAVVTAPIHKAAMLADGFEFAGHTEYLAKITGADRAVMMLVGGGLRTVPLTIHIPVAEVPPAITKEAVFDTGQIIVRALRHDLGIAQPRLAVSGLNPHAGEDGELGHEEKETILPAIEALRASGANVTGPLSADTMFHEEARARYDAALCMYHDQALIPVKMLGFWEGVNVTLGLPIVRTSPDHGTALDIAGQGKANPQSMIAAVRLAAQIADARSR